MIERRNVRRARDDIGSIGEAIEDRHIDRDEKIGIVCILRRGDEVFRMIQKAIDTGHGRIVSQKKIDAFKRKMCPKRTAQAQNGTQSIAIGRSVARDGDNGRILNQIQDALKSIDELR